MSLYLPSSLQGHADFVEPAGRAGMSPRWLWLPLLVALAVGVAGLAESCGGQSETAAARTMRRVP